MTHLDVRITPFGPDQSTLDRVAGTVIEHPVVQERLRDTRHQLLSIVLLDSGNKTARPALPNRYRATIYDYTNDRALLVEGRLDDFRNVEVTASAQQPLPSREEFDRAVAILMQDAEIGRGFRERLLRPYRPMPPLVYSERPEGGSERTIAVGLLPLDREVPHEIVGVNLLRQEVVRFEQRAPERSLAEDKTCGIPDASLPTTQFAAGQARVTVTQGSTVLWRFIVVRPAASSGTNGSGVEMRYVDYRGKRVLYRAHVPILNVQYDGDTCGPYLDWQSEEGMFQADGTDVAPGFRFCPTPAQTILDSGSDDGNFAGVAIYIEGQEVVLVSEMEAGWYRYISEWRLHANGTIRPRFGFTAVNTSSCVCNHHHHHVYWRFDFDLRTAGNNIVREFNAPPISGGSNWHTKNFEIRRFRDAAHKRRWRVENTGSGEAYDIIPGATDGTARGDSFAGGDLWVLRYRRSEIDHGVVATGPPYEANLDTWVNGEAIDNQDVVLWYAGHFTHDLHAGEEETGHKVGPDLKLVSW